jgi:hypothetical protein
MMLWCLWKRRNGSRGDWIEGSYYLARWDGFVKNVYRAGLQASGRWHYW